MYNKVWMAESTPIQMNHINRAIAPEFVLIEPNLSNVNTPLKSLRNYLKCSFEAYDFNSVILHSWVFRSDKNKNMHKVDNVWGLIEITDLHRLLISNLCPVWDNWNILWHFKDTWHYMGTFSLKKRKSLHAISLLFGKHNEDIEIFSFPYNFAWVDVVSIDVLNFVSTHFSNRFLKHMPNMFLFMFFHRKIKYHTGSLIWE